MKNIKKNLNIKKIGEKNVSLPSLGINPPLGKMYTVADILPVLANIRSNKERMSQFRKLKDNNLIPNVSKVAFRHMVQRCRNQTLDVN